MIAGQIHISLCVVVVFCFWAGLGCGPQPASRDDFSRNAYDTPVGMDSNPLPTALGKEKALELVRGYFVEGEEKLTNEEWVGQELKKAQGEILFPRWVAKRRGAHKYDVIFTYTILGSDYSIEKRGFSWMADVLFGLVGPARTLEPEDMSRYNVRPTKSRNTEEDHELILE